MKLLTPCCQAPIHVIAGGYWHIESVNGYRCSECANEWNIDGEQLENS